MDFSLTEKQRLYIKSIKDFSLKQLNDNVFEDDEASRFPHEKWKRFAELEFFGLPIDNSYGGHGEDFITTLLCIEALGKACTDNGFVHSIITQVLCAIQLQNHGSEELKKCYLPSICKGESICAQAISEPDAGSDVSSITTFAEKCGNQYTINGSKAFISNGSISDLVIVLASTSKNQLFFGGKTFFIIKANTPGLLLQEPEDKMGLRTLPNSEIVFNNCTIPEDNILGKPGKGMVVFDESMQIERTLMFSAHLGVMERLLAICTKYANSRKQGGRSIGNYQSISNKIADMKVRIELGRLILYKAAWLLDRKERANIESSIAKLYISESLQKTCLDAVQIHGAYGYMKDFGIERYLRDSIASTIYSGTSEIQRNIIARLSGIK